MPRSRRPITALAAVIALAGPAAAEAGTGWRWAYFPPSSATERSGTVSCPEGERVVGAHTAVDGPHEVVSGLTRLVPSSTLSQVEATVSVRYAHEEADHLAGARCLPDDWGLQRRSATSRPSSSDLQEVTVTCPSGDQVFGVGAAVSGAEGAVVLSAIEPDPVLRSVTARAEESVGGFADTWSVTAYAICGTPKPWQQLWLESDKHLPLAGDSATSRLLECQSRPGRLGLSAGFAVHGGMGDVLVTDLYTWSDGAEAKAMEDAHYQGRSWSLAAHQVCLDLGYA